jgi:putative membrane protein
MRLRDDRPLHAAGGDARLHQQRQGEEDMWMWGPDGSGWLGMGLGMILWLVVIVAVIWIAVRLLARPAGPPTMGPMSGPSPAEMLQMRFARGEIDEDEYRRRLAVLGEHPTGGTRT